MAHFTWQLMSAAGAGRSGVWRPGSGRVTTARTAFSKFLVAASIGACVGIGFCPQESGAQLAPGRAPIGRGTAETHFSVQDQLESPSVFFARQAGNGTLFIGTEDGVLRYAGQIFLPLALPFDSSETHQVRAMVETRDLTWWFGSRVGVFMKPREGPTRRIRVQDSLPDNVVYALAVTTALDGKERVVAATNRGLAVVDSVSAHPIRIPEPFIPIGMVTVAITAPDNVAELWVASSVGQIARFRRGNWTVWSERDGLPRGAIQQLISVSGLPNARMLAATDRLGALTWNGSGNERGRWVQLKGSPVDLNRAVEFEDANKMRQLWLGTTLGEVVRLMNGTWDTLDLTFNRAGTRIDAMTYLPDHGSRGAVYVGAYGGGLSRVAIVPASVPPATRVLTRKIVTSTLETASGDTLWVAGFSIGVQMFANGKALTAKTFPQLGNTNGHALIRWPDSPRGRTWYAADSGIATYAGANGWKREEAGLPDGYLPPMLFYIDSSATRDGVLYGAGSNGLIARDSLSAPWRIVPIPSGTAYVTAMTTLGGEKPALFIAANGKIFHRTSTDTNWVLNTALAGESEPVNVLCTLSPAKSKHQFVLAASRTGQLVWRSATSAWNNVIGPVADAMRPVPSRLQRAQWNPIEVRAMRCDSERERVVVGTRTGVVVARAEYDVATDALKWSLIGTIAAADGLPGQTVTYMAPVRPDGSMLVGTQFGLADLELDHVGLPPEPRLFERLSLLNSSEAWLPDGRKLSPSDNALRLELGLATFHRPEATLYRYQLSSAEGVRDSRDWTTEARFDLSRLAPGHYTLRVQARDFLGREYSDAPLTFTVLAPWYRTRTAMAMLIVIVLSVGYGVLRWRVLAVERRAQVIEANEKRVRVSERKFRELFDRAQDANLLVEDGRVTSANASAAALFGVAQSRELVDRAVDELIPAWPSLTTCAPDDSVQVVPEESQVPRGDNTVPVTITCAALTEDVQSVTHVVLRDLTEQRAAEKRRSELEAQVRETQNLESIGTLAGGVAHDFNNLLGVIRANSELAREAAVDPVAVTDHLTAVLDASDRARDLVRQILTFSRRSNSQQARVDLGALVLELQSIMRSLIPTTVNVQVRIPQHPVWVMGDRTQLQQVLLNLCSNAEYAMRTMPGGTLSIELSTQHGATTDDAVLRVSDTGVGMTQAIRERIFEPFFTTKPIGEGTGLGLSVLHGIVASHGGRVQVSSAQLQGTTFEVRFPTTTAATGEYAVINGAPPVSDTRSFRIVLVDDEAAIVQVMSRALARDGHKVAAFADPIAALAHVTSHLDDVDVVLTDQTMPGMTGDMLVTKLRELKSTLPVLIMTGFSYRLTPDVMARLGDVPVLQKPVGLKELRAIITQITSNGAATPS